MNKGAVESVAYQLENDIRQRIISSGPLPFSEFMQQALYAPEYGYYMAERETFGEHGDFVTAPEISTLFSHCLARQCQEINASLQGSILELGAGSGVMAADILAYLTTVDALPQQYYILEISPRLRVRQKQTIAEKAPQALARVQWVNDVPAVFKGVVLANELLDAMPVERFVIAEKSIQRLCVDFSEAQGFYWSQQIASAAFIEAVQYIQSTLPAPLPVHYCSEFNPGLNRLFAELAQNTQAVVALFIDYGYPRREYYLPERTEGTLLCHYQHRAHDDPLRYIGQQDITANVDFTAVAEAASRQGFDIVGYASQADFLLGCGIEQLYSVVTAGKNQPEALLQWSQQLKTLMLPSEMGERFNVIAISKGYNVALSGFEYRDSRQRL